MEVKEATVKIGLIGCGRIAQMFHLELLLGLPGAQLVAVADIDPEGRAAAARRAPRIAILDDYRQLVHQSEVDAVVICLPTGLHAPAAAEAFEQGKHVYLEKPLAARLDQAPPALAAWRSSGKIGMMGFNNRFHPLYVAVKRHLEAGLIGRLVGGRTSLCSARRDLPPWKRSRESGGGALLDLATHHADLVHFFFPTGVRRVAAVEWSVYSQGDNASMHMQMEDGPVIQGFFSATAVQENRLELYGDRGKLVADRRRGQLEFSPPEAGYGRVDRIREGWQWIHRAPADLWRRLMPPPEPSYRRALAAFIRAVRGEEPVPVDLAAGYRSLAVVCAAGEAARTGGQVVVRDVAPEYDL